MGMFSICEIGPRHAVRCLHDILVFGQSRTAGVARSPLADSVAGRTTRIMSAAFCACVAAGTIIFESDLRILIQLWR